MFSECTRTLYKASLKIQGSSLQVEYCVRRCSGLVVSVPASIDRPSRVRILARSLPTVRSNRRQIALLVLYCTSQKNYAVSYKKDIKKNIV